MVELNKANEAIAPETKALRNGIAATLLACVIWGSFPILFTFLKGVPAMDVMSHRAFWATFVMLAYIAMRGRFSELLAVFKRPKTLALLCLSSFLISVNWLTYIYSVQSGQALQGALGYYLMPLMSIALGAVINRERLDSIQSFAVLLAVIGVLIMAFGLGEWPTLALILAVSFTLYGYVKSKTSTAPTISVCVEIALVFPFSVFWIFFISDLNTSFGAGGERLFWLIMAGVLTAISLISYSYGAKRLSIATIGILFFFNPTLQSIASTLIIGETFSKWHLISFPLIWLACGLYVYDLFRIEAATRKRAKR